MAQVDIVEAFIIAWIFRDCGGRSGESHYIQKLEAQADDVRAVVRRYLAKGSGAAPKTDSGV